MTGGTDAMAGNANADDVDHERRSLFGAAVMAPPRPRVWLV